MNDATSTFDRPLVLEKDENIERFWQAMNSEPKPIFRNLEVEEGMRRCEKLAELKNSFGELMRGTEVRIQECMSSSGNLPVRYKVNVMKAGKVDIIGWLIGDTLSDPVNLVTQQIDNKIFFL